jgi:hypothetical protein
MNHQSMQPWIVALIANEAPRPQTAIASAMYAALERALYDRRSELHRRTFGWYGVDASAPVSKTTRR